MENVYILDFVVRWTFVNRYLGTLFLTPNSVYFINEKEISRERKSGFISSLLFLSSKGGVEKLFNAEAKDSIHNEKDLDGVLKKLDFLVSQQGGSIKINKLDISSFIVSWGYYPAMNVRTQDKKYIFKISFLGDEQRRNELKEYLTRYSYC